MFNFQTQPLNEKSGIIEFDNHDYRREICNIAKTIKSNKGIKTNLSVNDTILADVKKFSFHISSLSWIKNLDIYYKYDESTDFDAVAFSQYSGQNLFKLDTDKNIVLGSIYIQDNGKENILHVLFHEMCHLYDYSKFKQIWMNDLNFFLSSERKYDINSYSYDDDVTRYSIDDIHNVIIESMRFANFTESHAYLENINFEMFKRLNSYSYKYAIMSKEMCFAKSSGVLWDIYNLEKIVGNLRNINDDIKLVYFEKFKSDLQKAYYKFNSFDSLIHYIYKKLHKIILHSRSLFDYYYNLDSEAKRLYMLDENQKRNIVNTEHYIGSKRIID